ncbi:MAG TPA: hypothetical protein PKO06_03405, partial [Candidatus Ozemobacteraceae bacterium]|nr:hypothetical protein [Candidatus Ozemobacteraceae bacterium]
MTQPTADLHLNPQGAVSAPAKPAGPPAQPSSFILAGAIMLLFTGLIASGILAFQMNDLQVFYNLSFAVFCCYCGFIGWYNGIIRELAVLFHYVAPFVIGYTQARPLALHFGHTSWFAILGAFWACVFGSFVAIFILLYLLRALLWPTSFPGRVAGLALGLSEAMLLFIAIGNIYQAVPFADKELGQYLKPVMDSIAEKLSTPTLQFAAATTRDITDITLQIRKNGFDPNRVDQPALRRNFEPLVNSPSVQRLVDDQALMEKLRAGKSLE